MPALPPTVNVDWRRPAFKQDPLPTFARLRAAGPLVRTRYPVLGTLWLATTYDAVNDLLRDHQQFRQSPAATSNRRMALLLRWLPRTLRPLTNHMLLRDEPDHRRLRGLVERAFLVRSAQALRPRLEVLADEALDRLATQARGDSVDLLVHFARPFPLAVICELLGLPPEDRPRFSRWAATFSTISSVAGIPWALWGLRQLLEYLRQEIARQQVQPREGLLAALIQAEEGGERLTEDELVAMVFLLLVAGHETTLHQIAGSVLALLDHPQQLQQLSADWSQAETAVNELLRYVSFAQIAKPRYARQDTEFCGQRIRQGDMLMPCLGSANFDPSRFENPEQLQLRRTGPRHVGLGAGIHYCLGAALARLETEIALQRLFTRYPQLRLAVPRTKVAYSRRPGTRGLLGLPVAW